MIHKQSKVEKQNIFSKQITEIKVTFMVVRKELSYNMSNPISQCLIKQKELKNGQT